MEPGRLGGGEGTGAPGTASGCSDCEGPALGCAPAARGLIRWPAQDRAVRCWRATWCPCPLASPGSPASGGGLRGAGARSTGRNRAHLGFLVCGGAACPRSGGHKILSPPDPHRRRPAEGRGAGRSRGLSTSAWQAGAESSGDPARGERRLGPAFRRRNSPSRPQEDLPHEPQPAGPSTLEVRPRRARNPGPTRRSRGFSTSAWQAGAEASDDPAQGERRLGPAVRRRNSPGRPREDLPHEPQPAGPFAQDRQSPPPPVECRS